ncbi:MAG TPA: DUF5655 domain-containing protein [Pirellula sp.]|nr:DUF5655 domain-containing protein [Pirellula sp.]
MLYKLKKSDTKTTFVRLNATTLHEQGLLESQMEQWLADNPTAVLPEDEAQVLVISQETPFKNVTDILAIDAQGNVLIIEVKRGETPRDVIAQALEYASDVADWDYDQLNKTAIQYFARRKSNFKSLMEAFSTTFGISPDQCSTTEFNQQQRIFIVGESIDEKIERTARWLLNRGVAINCLSYTCYLSNDESRETFLDLNEVVRPNELRGGGRSNIVRTEPPSETEAIGRLPDGLKSVYQHLKKAVFDFGGPVETYATRNNFVFKCGRVFAEIPQVRKGNRLVIRVRPEGFNLPENSSKVVDGLNVRRVPDSYLWTVNHEIEVTEASDTAAVLRLLRRSHDGACRRG